MPTRMPPTVCGSSCSSAVARRRCNRGVQPSSVPWPRNHCSIWSETMDDSPWMPPAPGAPRPEPEAQTPAPPSLPPPPPVSPWSRDAEQGADASDLPAPTIVDPVSTGESGRPRRSKLVVGAGVAAVLAVGAAGIFAVSRFTGSAQGGAGTPSELGTALLTAIENEDVLGMTDLLSPGERDVFRQPLIDLVSELTRLEVLSPEADLAKIDGLDIVLADTSVTARPTNVDDIVNVQMQAEATSTVDGQQVPIGALITDNLDPDDVTEIRGTVQTETEHFDVTLTAVEDGGRWYFSLFHTAAETARADLEPEPDIPVDGIGADGGESPEEAVDLTLDRIAALDLAGTIRMLNPGEAAALQRYAPLFLDEAQAELDDAGVQLEIRDTSFRVEGDGDQRTVLFDSITFAVTGPDEDTGQQIEAVVTIADDCVHAESQG